MKILMLSPTFPYPPTRGRNQSRTFHLMKYLSERHEVTLVTQRPDDVTDTEVELLRESMQELVVFPMEEDLEVDLGLLAKAKRFGSFIQQGTPPRVLSLYSDVMQEWVDEAVNVGRFDAIASEDSANEIYIRPQWREKLGTVVNIYNSVYRMCKYQLEHQTWEQGLGDRLDLPLLYRYEQQYCQKFSEIVTTTESDRKFFKEFEPDAKINLIPNGVDLNRFPVRISNQGGQKLIFIGAMDRADNIDAVRFFSLEVFPEIQKRYPEATLELVGASPVPQVLELDERPGITVTGEVSSIVEHLHWATVCVLPMQSGFGLENKTLKVMATGVPIVASDMALQELKVDGSATVPLRAMRANEVDEYVYAIGRLFEDPKLREKLSENGREMVESEYTWEKAGQLYEQVLQDACTF